MVQRSSFWKPHGNGQEPGRNNLHYLRRGPVRRDPPVQSMDPRMVKGSPYRSFSLAGYDKILPVIP